MKFVKQEKKPFEDFRTIIDENSKPISKNDWLVKYIWWIVLTPVLILEFTESLWRNQFNAWLEPFLNNGLLMIPFGAFLAFFIYKLISSQRVNIDIKDSALPMKLLVGPWYLLRLIFGKRAFDALTMIGLALGFLSSLFLMVFGIYKLFIIP